MLHPQSYDYQHSISNLFPSHLFILLVSKNAYNYYSRSPSSKEKSAEKVDRTPDLMIFSHTLSQLSYLGFYIYPWECTFIPSAYFLTFFLKMFFFQQTSIILKCFNSIFRYNLCDVVMLVHREPPFHLLLATIAQFQCFLSRHIFLHITKPNRGEPSKDDQIEQGECRKDIRDSRNSSSVMCPNNQGNISKEHRRPLRPI